LTARYTSSWGQDEFWDGATYANNRRSGWGYDADGRTTTIDTRSYTFDASGQTTLMTGQKWVINHYVATSQTAGYDGDGVKVKDTTSGVTTYYLRSSALGGAIIEELNSSGEKNVGYVYAGGRLLARQSNSQVTWTHTTPAGTGKYELFAGGGIGRTEFDPLGADVGLFAPPTPDTGGGEGDIGGSHTGGLMDSRYSDMFNLAAGCTIDGMAASCSTAVGMLNSGAGVQCPNNDCSLRSVTINITWQNGDKRTIQGFVSPFSGIPDGYNHTFTGGAAVAAATAWNNGLSGGFQNALVASIAAGTAMEQIVALARKYAHAPQGSRNQTNFTPEQFERFKTCLRDMFQVEYRNHSFTLPSSGGDSYFYGHTERGAHWYSISAIGDFTVRTDQQSYSMQHLAYKADRAGVGRVAGGMVWGFTDSSSPYVNAIAYDSDLAIKGSERFGGWVYELGNALSYITGLTPKIPADARDRYGVGGEPGAAFEDCVFGGRLNSSGSITPPK
jgi:hypothetical protein